MTLGGCQNDGHIGYLFGVWRVEAYMVDGVRIESPLVDATTLAFQGNVVEVVAITDAYQSATENYGTWSESGNTFTLDFTHHDNLHPAGSDFYQAPAWLGMTDAAPMAMTVTHRSGRELTLEWHDTAEGSLKTYKLKKTW